MKFVVDVLLFEAIENFIFWFPVFGKTNVADDQVQGGGGIITLLSIITCACVMLSWPLMTSSALVSFFFQTLKYL